eukprot:CAMPEP_0170431270 /NCGR_PEP_ID=MMETSP0117_2-20130122/41308_1 /TAXON_ID=400756 /ORGANISM="Durinskia baltica, Strain CSIRO CS-38" /LENGTH=32 /DNA_ID= /DNA_START= /DNA_END= /DNA_ORIENTATION=
MTSSILKFMLAWAAGRERSCRDKRTRGASATP